MKNKFKKVISLLLASIMVFGAAPIAALSELDFSNFSLFSFFENKANASREDHLTFVLINDGAEYEVSTCDKSAWGNIAIPSTHKGLPVTRVGEMAFALCFNITSITIPNSITSIGYGAFKNCHFSSLTLPNSVTTIEHGAFTELSCLTSLTLPNSVTSIGNYAFSLCNKLTTITIPYSVTSLGDHAFSGSGFTSINVSPENIYFSSDNNGVLYNKDKSTLIKFPEQNTKISFEIPSTVTSIGKAAFENSINLATVIIPDSVTSIGDEAFKDCRNIANLVLPNSLISIGSDAFLWTGLNSIHIPANVQHISPGALLPLQGVTIASENQYYSSDSCGVVYNKDKTELFTFFNNQELFSFDIPPGVTKIEEYAFSHSNLKNITIPNGVTTIADYAFEYCDKLTTITIPEGVLSIGNYAFQYCSGLTNISIANSVTVIGNYAFAFCDHLPSITIPVGVKTVERAAFMCCKKLVDISIGSGVASIEDDVFGSCDMLSTISVSEDNKFFSSDEYGVLYNKDKTQLITYPRGNTRNLFKIPDGVQHIGQDAFSYCANLKTVDVPNSVTTIGAYAFYYCGITTISLPNSITNIEIGAFWGSGLIDINIPDTVLNIGYNAFSDCHSLTNITVSQNNKHYSSDDFGVLYSKDKTTLIKYPAGKDDIFFEIPSGVTIVERSAFATCSKLVNVIIPNGVTSIGDYAFATCYWLMNITIPASVTNIGKCILGEDFYRCEDIYYLGSKNDWNNISIHGNNSHLFETNIHFEENTIGNTKYLSFILNSDCTSYTVYACSKSFSGELTIPSTHNGLPVTTIGNMAFEDCANISKVILPHSLKNIVYDAFWGCTRLEEFAVSDENEYFCTDSYGVLFNKDKTVLVRYPLGNDRPSYEIPYGVNELAYSSFRCCVNLSSIILPTSVTDIDSYAFPNDDILEEFYLKDVYYTGTQEQFEKIFISRANEVFWDATWHYNYKAGDAEQPIETIKPNDGSDNVLIEFPKGSFGENEAGMSLKVEDITNSSKPSKGDFKLNGHKMLALYNITPVDTAGNVIQPNGKVKVIINIFSGVKNGDNVIIIHYPHNKPVEKLEGKVINNKIVVETDSFSEFGIYREMTVWEKIIDFFVTFFNKIFSIFK